MGVSHPPFRIGLHRLPPSASLLQDLDLVRLAPAPHQDGAAVPQRGSAGAVLFFLAMEEKGGKSNKPSPLHKRIAFHFKSFLQ